MLRACQAKQCRRRGTGESLADDHHGCPPRPQELKATKAQAARTQDLLSFTLFQQRSSEDRQAEVSAKGAGAAKLHATARLW